MPILSNSKYELFAQELAKGSTASAAYVAAGYKRHDSNAGRLSKNEQVRSRVTELLTESAERSGVTIDRLVSELAKIAFANASDFFEWGPDGVTIIPSAKLTSDQRAVVSEAQETRAKGHGESTIKIKLSDKQAAIDKLMRHLGAYKNEITGPGGGPIKTETTVVYIPANGRD